MPRKTKEQKELEEKKEVKKTTKKASATTAKTATATKKASTTTTAKKATATKKTSTTTTAKKATATKKASTATTVKKTTKKEATSKTTNKKSSTKKATKSTKLTKKESLLDPTLEIAEYYDLPYRYNKTVVKILAQTPTTLFVYWEISDEDIENYKKQYGDNFFEITKPVLIVHNETLGYSFEVEINDFANCWYLKVNTSRCEYKIELGRRPIEHNEKINQDYIYVATSNQIEAPNDHILLEEFPAEIRFKNVKNNNEYSRKISELSIGKNMQEIYDIYNLYKLVYHDENIETWSISNPSSGENPSSGVFSSQFK